MSKTRAKLSKKTSKRIFKKAATQNKLNKPKSNTRGGFRL